MFEIGDVIQVKKEYVYLNQRQESTLRVVIEYRPKIDYLLVCELNSPDKRVCTRGEFHEFVKKGNDATKFLAEDIIRILPSEEEKQKELNDLRNFILSFK